jgi:flagellar M-ring protein FliF
LPDFSAWRRLSDRNKVVAIAAAVAIAISIAALTRAATTPRMALLYSGLDPAASGEILQSLEAMDVRSDVRGDAIYVPEDKRDATRMALARDGLPRQSQAGFEILDDLKSFATSSEMFDATYWRAKEGELARTILAENGVRGARVHLAIPKRTAFVRSQAAPSAVVTVRMSYGRLDVERARAVRLLVALAVPGLSPDRVAVLDAAGGVVLSPGESDDAQGTLNKTSDRERALEQDLVQLLEARVGPGNARVKVTLAVSDEQVVRQERLVDPERRALATRESTEISEQGSDASGVVSVASNLPEGDATTTTTPSQSQRNESTEAARYELSEVKTETVTMPGALKQVQVAVLINQLAETSAEAAPTPTPRTEAELESLRKLVAAAIGFNETRGDVVTIESLPFDTPEAAGSEATSDFFVTAIRPNLIPILQLVIPAIVTLVLALFVLKPLLSNTNEAVTPAMGAAPLSSPAGVAPAVAQLSAPSQKHDTPIDVLQRIAGEETGAASTVLKSWLEQSEPTR